MTAETGVKWVLRFIGVTTLPAFAAAVMPQRWLVFVLNWIEPGCSVGLLGSYITRCLMGVYAFMGIQAVVWSTDVRRYRPLILSLCVCVIIAVPMALAALSKCVGKSTVRPILGGFFQSKTVKTKKGSEKAEKAKKKGRSQ